MHCHPKHVLLIICFLTCSLVVSGDTAPTFVNIPSSTIKSSQRYIDLLFNKKQQPSNQVSTLPTIAYGQQASFGQFPFMASLQMASAPLPTVLTNATIPISYHYCGGSLLWPNLILTGGHCLGNEQIRTIPSFVLVGGTVVQVDPGLDPITNAPEVFAVSAYAVHPQYYATDNLDAVFNDIAIIQISGQSQQPYINVSTTTPRKGQLLTAIGWGYTDVTVNQGQYNDGISSETLMYTNYMVSSASDLAPSGGQSCPDFPGILCMQATPVDVFNGNGTLGYQSTCTGDSGGPEMINNTNIQAGITSFGPDGCGNTTWDAVTNVSHYYKSFIWPSMVNYGIPSPITSKSQCSLWKAVVETKTVYSLADGGGVPYYKRVNGVKSAQSCGSLCVVDSRCYNFKYDSKRKYCWLSSTRNVMLLKSNATSNTVTNGYLKCQ